MSCVDLGKVLNLFETHLWNRVNTTYLIFPSKDERILKTVSLQNMLIIKLIVVILQGSTS